MVGERHYNAQGAPAFVVLYKRDDTGEKFAVRLVYARAEEFARLWAKAVEVVVPGA